jgi:hypothetical protein
MSGQVVAVSRAELEVEVDKSERGPRVTYSKFDQKGCVAETAQSKFKGVFSDTDESDGL